MYHINYLLLPSKYYMNQTESQTFLNPISQQYIEHILFLYSAFFQEEKFHIFFHLFETNVLL